jgi:hypothetical protein
VLWLVSVCCVMKLVPVEEEEIDGGVDGEDRKKECVRVRGEDREYKMKASTTPFSFFRSGNEQTGGMKKKNGKKSKKGKESVCYQQAGSGAFTPPKTFLTIHT